MEYEWKGKGKGKCICIWELTYDRQTVSHSSDSLEEGRGNAADDGEAFGGVVYGV